MLAHPRLTLIRNAGEAAIVLDRQLNTLLDAYDFCIQRYENDISASELKDVQVSIRELGALPHQVATRLTTWRDDGAPVLSPLGFEIFVLNEFHIHMHALATFLTRRQIDLDSFDQQLVASAFESLRAANLQIT